jgi:heme/copper-type cytochrome/quinol oxidase subunit 2
MGKQKKYLAEFLLAVSAAVCLFVTNAQVALGAGWNKSDYDTSVTGLPRASSLMDIIKNITLWILGIFGFVAVIGFVISGIMYLVAAGDEDRQQQAKRAMIYSITGVIVGLAGLVVIYAADTMLRGSGGF